MRICGNNICLFSKYIEKKRGHGWEALLRTNIPVKRPVSSTSGGPQAGTYLRPLSLSLVTLNQSLHLFEHLSMRKLSGIIPKESSVSWPHNYTT